jgi:hypothetical protein
MNFEMATGKQKKESHASKATKRGGERQNAKANKTQQTGGKRGRRPASNLCETRPAELVRTLF